MKTDIFKREMFYVYEGQYSEAPIILSVDAVKEIIHRNKQGIEVADVEEFIVQEVAVEKETDFAQVVGQDSLTRFDKSKRPNNRNNRGKGNNDRRRDNRPASNTSSNDNRSPRKDQGTAQNTRPPRDPNRQQTPRPPRSNQNTQNNSQTGEKPQGNRPPRRDRPPRGPKPQNPGNANPPAAS
jgi:hypothetical protein